MGANPVGFHTALTPDIHERIISAVPEVIIPSQCAAKAGISKQNLSNWLKRGEADLTKGINSPFAQLFDQFKKAQAEIVSNLIQRVMLAPDNYRALTWVLEKCFREDFGAESEEMRELKELFKMILPLIGKGDLSSGNLNSEEEKQDPQE